MKKAHRNKRPKLENSEFKCFTKCYNVRNHLSHEFINALVDYAKAAEDSK